MTGVVRALYSMLSPRSKPAKTLKPLSPQIPRKTINEQDGIKQNGLQHKDRHRDPDYGHECGGGKRDGGRGVLREGDRSDVESRSPTGVRVSYTREARR